mgnify:CR=1 FL=1
MLAAHAATRGANAAGSGTGVPVTMLGSDDESVSFDLPDGAVVIAAITSCTNTSNPSVMVGAGLLARLSLIHI